jgi:hypothetical protein
MLLFSVVNVHIDTHLKSYFYVHQCYSHISSKTLLSEKTNILMIHARKV